MGVLVFAEIFDGGQQRFLCAQTFDLFLLDVQKWLLLFLFIHSHVESHEFQAFIELCFLILPLALALVLFRLELDQFTEDCRDLDLLVLGSFESRSHAALTTFVDLQQLLHLIILIVCLILLNKLLTCYLYLVFFYGDQVAYLELQVLIALFCLRPAVVDWLFLRVEALDLQIQLTWRRQFLQLIDHLVPVLLLMNETCGFRFQFGQSFGNAHCLPVALLHSDPTDVVIVVNFLCFFGVFPDGCLKVLPALDLLEGLHVLGLRRGLQF